MGSEVHLYLLAQAGSKVRDNYAQGGLVLALHLGQLLGEERLVLLRLLRQPIMGPGRLVVDTVGQLSFQHLHTWHRVSAHVAQGQCTRGTGSLHTEHRVSALGARGRCNSMTNWVCKGEHCITTTP